MQAEMCHMSDQISFFKINREDGTRFAVHSLGDTPQAERRRPSRRTPRFRTPYKPSKRPLKQLLTFIFGDHGPHIAQQRILRRFCSRRIKHLAEDDTGLLKFLQQEQLMGKLLRETIKIIDKDRMDHVIAHEPAQHGQ